MSQLTMTIVYDGERPFKGPKGARPILKAALNTLSMLESIDKKMSGKRRPRLMWDVHIFSLADRAVVEFNPVLAEGNEKFSMDDFQDIVDQVRRKENDRMATIQEQDN